MDPVWSTPVPLLNLDEARWNKEEKDDVQDKPSTSKHETASPQDAPEYPPLQQGQDKVND